MYPAFAKQATDMVQSNRFPSTPAYPILQVLQDGKCHDRIRFSKVVLSSISGFPVVVFAGLGGVGWGGVFDDGEVARHGILLIGRSGSLDGKLDRREH